MTTLVPSLRAGAALARGAAFVLLLALTACGTTSPQPHFPELTYGHHGTIDLDVARIEFVTTYEPPLRAPNVEHRSPANPIVVMERWTRDRLRAVGSSGVARVVLTNASIIQTPLKVQGGLQGLFTTDQGARYDSTIDVEIQIRDDAGVQRAFAKAHAARSQTLAEDATVIEREKTLFKLVEATMTDINTQFERSIRQYLGRYVVN